MTEIVYFSPNPSQASGGVKVIYRHASLINEMGLDNLNACVYHFVDPASESVWHEQHFRQKDDGVLVASRDFVVLPECHLGDYWSRCAAQGIRYSIFVQNAYLLGAGLDRTVVRKAVESASLIMVISDDSRRYLEWLFPDVAPRVLPLRWSIPAGLFSPDQAKSRVITFMPRRMADHAFRVIDLLLDRLPPGWQIRALDGMTESQVSDALSQSRIFMAFSGLEGLALPPGEAAMAGNKVVGYHGQGGKEYWDPALFRQVECGDLLGFAQAVLEEVRMVENRLVAGHPPQDESMKVARGLLVQRFSPGREKALLREFVQRVQQCMVSQPAASA